MTMIHFLFGAFFTVVFLTLAFWLGAIIAEHWYLHDYYEGFRKVIVVIGDITFAVFGVSFCIIMIVFAWHETLRFEKQGVQHDRCAVERVEK